MVRQMLEALIAKHGEEVVLDVLNQARNHLVEGDDLKAVEVKKAEELIADHVRQHPAVSPIVARAWQLTHGHRRAAYGTPTEVFAGYAKIWSGLLGRKLTEDLTASDVALCMTGLKLARESQNPADDNVTDAHGYLILHDEILHPEEPVDEHA
jgi:hypothetical protein